MRWLRRIVTGVAALAGLWLVALLVIGWTADGCVRDRARERLAASMRAQVTIGALDLGLVDGSVAIDELKVLKDDRGLFRMAIRRVDVDLQPLGLALVQDSVGAIHARGVDVELSALGALDLGGEGRGEPITFDRLVLEDLKVSISPTSLLPVGKIDVTIERAVAGRTTLRTPMSWLFALQELRARIALPLDITARLEYRAGKLRLSGELFDTPVEVPFDIPVLEPARELDQLAELGKRLAIELGKEGVERWLKAQAEKQLDKLVP